MVITNNCSADYLGISRCEQLDDVLGMSDRIQKGSRTHTHGTKKRPLPGPANACCRRGLPETNKVGQRGRQKGRSQPRLVATRAGGTDVGASDDVGTLSPSPSGFVDTPCARAQT